MRGSSFGSNNHCILGGDRNQCISDNKIVSIYFIANLCVESGQNNNMDWFSDDWNQHIPIIPKIESTNEDETRFDESKPDASKEVGKTWSNHVNCWTVSFNGQTMMIIYVHYDQLSSPAYFIHLHLIFSTPKSYMQSYCMAISHLIFMLLHRPQHIVFYFSDNLPKSYFNLFILKNDEKLKTYRLKKSNLILL